MEMNIERMPKLAALEAKMIEASANPQIGAA